MDISCFCCACVGYDDLPGIFREICGDERVAPGLLHDVECHQKDEYEDQWDESEEDVDSK